MQTANARNTAARNARLDAQREATALAERVHMDAERIAKMDAALQDALVTMTADQAETLATFFRWVRLAPRLTAGAERAPTPDTW